MHLQPVGPAEDKVTNLLPRYRPSAQWVLSEKINEQKGVIPVTLLGMSARRVPRQIWAVRIAINFVSFFDVIYGNGVTSSSRSRCFLSIARRFNNDLQEMNKPRDYFHGQWCHEVNVIGLGYLEIKLDLC